MVVNIDNQILVRFEPVKLDTKIITFIHAEIDGWNKQLKDKCIKHLSTFGRVFALADNPKLLKFCLGLGGKKIMDIPAGTIVRFN